MFVVVVEFTLHAQHVEAFRARVREQAADSLELEPECRVFDVCIDPRRKDIVLLYEVYADRAAFDAHLASAHFAAFDAVVKPWFSDKRVTFYERI
jgi:quinol monooxygenase YgiN